MRKPIAAANWKMNGDRQLILEFAAYFAASAPTCETIWALPYPYLALAKDNSLTQLAAQDISAHSSGAHTGEVSANMVRDCGASYVILGHSERRAAFGEDEEILLNKWQRARDCGLQVIYCIGESRREYEDKTTKEILKKQLQPIFDANLFCKDSIVAYEPVWAIGSGLTATPQYAQDIHNYIRTLFSKECATIADCVRIVYGGSVNADNAAALFAKRDIDGFLVGGASLQKDVFSQIIKAML